MSGSTPLKSLTRRLAQGRVAFAAIILLSIWSNKIGISSVKRKDLPVFITLPQNLSSLDLPTSPSTKVLPIVVQGENESKSSTPSGVSKFLWQYPASKWPATNATRAIALLSMGPNAARSTLLERCILSIRKRGVFLGPIMVLTDADLVRYKAFTERDPNLVILQPQLKDWNWDLRRDMPYKRFKTYLLEYLQRDKRLMSVQWLYYLDIDIVVGRSLWKFFQHLERMFLKARDTANNTSHMTMFEGNFGPLQGGQFLLHRESSQGCLDRWRFKIDENMLEHKDQVALTRMWQEQNNRSQSAYCMLTAIAQEPHLRFLRKHDMIEFVENPNRTNYATLMHIKNTQYANQISDELQKQFFQQLLDLSPSAAKDISGKLRIRPNRTWSAMQVGQPDSP